VEAARGGETWLTRVDAQGWVIICTIFRHEYSSLPNHLEASVLITIFGVESCSPCVTVAAPEE
jgi:hypothetical protein